MKGHEIVEYFVGFGVMFLLFLHKSLFPFAHTPLGFCLPPAANICMVGFVSFGAVFFLFHSAKETELCFLCVLN